MKCYSTHTTLQVLLALGVLIIIGAISCSRNDEDSLSADSIAGEDSRRVLLIYAAAYNNLSSDIKQNIEELSEGYLPGSSSGENVLLVFSKFTAKSGDYNTATPSTLTRMYSQNGACITDTLLTFDGDFVASSAEGMNEVLSYVAENFTAAGYGLLFSSHSTGWVPCSYYNGSTSLNSADGSIVVPSSAQSVAAEQDEIDPHAHMVKGFGADYSGSASSAYYLDLKDLTDAIPLHLDYIAFDACLDAGVEIAYELKDVCDQIVAAPTEVLSAGFDYSNLGQRLLYGSTADLQGVCEDFYAYYAAQSGSYQSATISLIDCSYMEELADVCSVLFLKYQEELNSSMDYGEAQAYFRTSSKHWYYDLADVLRVAGATSEEMEEVETLLELAVPYEAHTDYFLGLALENCCGLSMYLPADGDSTLDAYYKGLSWNIATGLVQ